MSRHVLDTDGSELVVGYDPPLLTFFWQYIDPSHSSDPYGVVAEGGQREGEIETTEALIESMKRETKVYVPWGMVDEDIQKQLEKDRCNSKHRTPLQIQLASIWDDE
ncbi:MAG: hypothetical protein UT24_C0033G0005 [Candidatus Woesebacteria bacterium GW2011_GWB1_39_12]|uniref:Uncharacterized protein n=1 Tax=Candidatus Woesebacteria bacterium GW2011_GWB1_39_12 TaxID=1618574 RepID=A0A0G0MET5_9BACT|nr:MAG: hypothetical protein UT24_C0033G0005 [Candidatus Woesebacteria bacterium GW2011_GWB1_39_12]